MQNTIGWPVGNQLAEEFNQRHLQLRLSCGVTQEISMDHCQTIGIGCFSEVFPRACTPYMWHLDAGSKKIFCVKSALRCLFNSLRGTLGSQFALPALRQAQTCMSHTIELELEPVCSIQKNVQKGQTTTYWQCTYNLPNHPPKCTEILILMVGSKFLPMHAIFAQPSAIWYQRSAISKWVQKRTFLNREQI